MTSDEELEWVASLAGREIEDPAFPPDTKLVQYGSFYDISTGRYRDVVTKEFVEAPVHPTWADILLQPYDPNEPIDWDKPFRDAKLKRSNPSD